MDNEKGIARKIGSMLRGAVARDKGLLVTLSVCHAKKLTLGDTAKLAAMHDGLAKELAALARAEETDPHIAHTISDVLTTDRYSDDANEIARALYALLPGTEEELNRLILDLELEDELSGGSFREEGSTPESVTALALGVLGLRDGERVGDFGTGTGSFLVRASERADCELFYGCDVASDAVAVAKIRAAAIGPNATVEQADMFHIDGTFDKCFSNYPFGMKKRGFVEDALYSLKTQGVEDLPKAASSDWLFNLQLFARTRQGGRAVGVMTRGSCYNGADEAIRRYFVANGWVEAVIALPEGVFSPYTKIATNMIVLSRGNEAVRFVDATGICQQGRRKTTFGDGDVEEIVRLLGEDEDGRSCSKDYGELERGGFNLDPTRHLAEEIVVKNGVPLASLAESITRGSGIGQRELEALNSNVPTPFRYLEAKNIAGGQIDDSMGYLMGIDPGKERYCVSDGDLLMTKTGPNFKFAVAEIPEGSKVLATANLYIVRLDRDKVDPWYVKLYLESEQGMAQLRRACVGTAQPNFPQGGFADVMVPMVANAQQQKIVGKYESLRQEIAIHELAIERARQKIAGLLEEE